MSNRRRLVAAPAPDTDYMADSFADLSSEFIVVAVRVPGAKHDHWQYTFCTADIPVWRDALRRGVVTSGQQLRDGRWYLLGKLA